MTERQRQKGTLTDRQTDRQSKNVGVREGMFGDENVSGTVYQVLTDSPNNNAPSDHF